MWMQELLYLLKDTATTEIYTLSLHDALPIFHHRLQPPRADILDAFIDLGCDAGERADAIVCEGDGYAFRAQRSEEHTSELQSRQYLVCRLLLEKHKLQTS